MGTTESLTSLAMIFIMIIPGLFLGKRNIITQEQSLGLTAIVTNLTWPCLVIDAMQIPFSFEVLRSCGHIAVIMLIIFAAAFLISLLLVKVTKMDKKHSYLFIFMIIVANTGFMGIPLINALYGGKATFYASVVEMVSDIFIFTLGIMLIQMAAGKKLRVNPREFLTPGIFGVLIGFLLFLLNIELPGFLGESIGIIGSATTPITMVVIGMQIGRMKVKDVFSGGIIYIMSFVKLLVIPILAYVIFYLILGDTSLMANVVIMDFAMPAGMCVAIFAQQYGADYEFASKGVLISTLLSMATIPLFTILLSL